MPDLSPAAREGSPTPDSPGPPRTRTVMTTPGTRALRVVNVVGVVGFVGLLAALQALPTGLGFARGTVSAYCFRPYGELARFALASLSVGGVASAVLVRRLPGRTGRGALLLVAVWALGVATDVFATTDPPHTRVTTHGQVHLVATGLATSCLSIATVLVALACRGRPRWTIVVSAASVLAFFGFLVAPDAVAGLAERILLGVDALWLVLVATLASDPRLQGGAGA